MVDLTQCKKADIYDSRDKLMCQAEVQSDSMNSLILLVPDTFQESRLGTYGAIFFHPMEGLVTCTCKLTMPIQAADNRISLRCDIVEIISQEDRRMDLKVSVQTPINIRVVRSSTEKVLDPPNGYRATALNISAGGIYFQTAVQLNRGHRVMLDFPTAEGKLPLTAEILRVEPPKNEIEPVYGYGCQFIRTPQRVEASLRSFVFQREKILRQTRK